MRPQLLGIYISLMVHGMAVIFLFVVSRGMTPAVHTVALDFSLDSGGRMGMEGTGKRGGPGGDEALPQAEAPMNPENTRLFGISEPPPLVSEERPLFLAEATLAAEALPKAYEAPVPVVEAPPPFLAEPPPVPEETPPVAKKPPQARRVFRDNTPKTVHKTVSPKVVRPKPVPRKKTVEAILDEKAKPDPPVQAAKMTSPPTLVDSRHKKRPTPPSPEPKPAASSDSLNTFPAAGPIATADRSAESRMNSARGLSEASSEPNGSGSRGGPADRGAGNGESLRGDGGSAYLKAHFSFIQGHLREHLCYPNLARKRGWSGKVLVSFTIHPDGRADNIAIQKSCGISLLDKSAMKTVHNACPFPFPPMAARIVIPIVYQLN